MKKCSNEFCNADWSTLPVTILLQAESDSWIYCPWCGCFLEDRKEKKRKEN